MKLHLPVILRQSVLACLTTVSAMTLNCGSAWADSVNEPQNLVFDGASLIWNTDAGNQSFTNEDGEASAFAAGDNVRFESDSSVVLGGNITAGQVSIAGGADVVIERESYVLDFDTLALQGGSLQIGESLSLGAGDALAVGSNGAVLKSALLLGEDAKLSVDFSGRGAATSLNGSTLSLQGGSQLQLSGCGNGDGKTYVLFTDVSSLTDAAGNTIALNSSNNAISHYFDTSKPGTGFWAGSTLQLSADGALQLVRHNEETKDAVKISERQTESLVYSYYKSISFADIDYSSDSSSARGGAIEGNAVTLNSNGSVTFNGISVSSSKSYAYGSAICGETVTLSGNGSVTFGGNSAYAEDYLSSVHGGAIEGNTVTLNDNGRVIFSGNSAYTNSLYSSAYGGAICGDSVALNGNGSVEFCNNTASSSFAYRDIESPVYGGAIYVYRFGSNYGEITLNGNGSVTFSGNSASAFTTSSAVWGGAIYGGEITMNSNGSVTFSGNSVSASTDSAAYGGAISGVSVTLRSNKSVTFSGNSVSGHTFAHGGAISGDITLSGNERVAFIGNSVSSVNADASGGAISGYMITLSGNGCVTFSRNIATTSSSDADAHGGAINAGESTISFTNNQHILFEKNAEVKNGTYRLRSIYTDGDLNLSAPKSGEIRFNDSIYVRGNMALNADYTDDANKIHGQTGDIIFSGATTEDDLYQVKGNVAGTKAEILASRTSEVNSMTKLYGGRLRVEDGAVYKGQGITAEIGSESTVRVKDAELSHVGYALEFNSGTTLEVAGNSIIRGEVNLKEGSMFILEEEATLSLHETARADTTTLTVNGGALLEGNSTLNAGLTLVDGALLDMAALDAGAVTVNGALTLGSNLTMGENLLALLQTAADGSTFVLFTGLDALYLNGESQSGMTLADEMWVELCFSNLESSSERSYYLLYNNTVSGEGVLSIAVSGTSASVPEPTTATLSLLALAALAARRRRK